MYSTCAACLLCAFVASQVSEQLHITERVVEGVAEGVVEGVAEGVAGGVAEGVVEGVTGSMIEGVISITCAVCADHSGRSSWVAHRHCTGGFSAGVHFKCVREEHENKLNK